ncbi:MAG: AtpZ/AtpI family protein [Nitrospinaceae bacterium]|jgi:ATP synthase protein I|nr:AtpZ/AtpI family protein [Nitrospinaceae bacterium]
MSIAFRLGVEMAVATFLGAVMGYALDRFFNTKPWLMVIGLFFGVAAGGLGVYRVAQEIQFTDNDSNEEDQ